MGGRGGAGSGRSRRLKMEPLEQRLVLDVGPVISELMALNSNTLVDVDGDSSDWIEIYNPTPAAIHLDGWHLTDRKTDLARWELPDVWLEADEHLVVFASGKDRRDPAGQLHTDFSLSGGGEYLALVEPDGTTVAHAYDEFPPQFTDVSYGVNWVEVTPGSWDWVPGFYTSPTPWDPNGPGIADLGPILRNLTENPAPPASDEDLLVTVEVDQAADPVAGVTLHYRVMFGLETALPMVDDGTSGDATAGDGIYSVVIPSADYAAGDMVRWYVTATDTGGGSSRGPLFLLPDNSPEYFGTVVVDPSVSTPLPVFEYFVEDVAAAGTVDGTRASVFYLGEFYDNVLIHQRGGNSTTGRKFEFNDGREFRFDPQESRVGEINLNEPGSEDTYMRQVLAWETYAEAGAPGSMAFPMHTRRNGTFLDLRIFVEQPNEDMLERNGLDRDGAFYKMYNPVTSSSVDVEKKTRTGEGNSDLAALIDAVDPMHSTPQRQQDLLDLVDVPAVINYLAVTTLVHDNDHLDKNFFLYRDTEGTGQWLMLPWDKDLTFGVNWGLPGVIGNQDPYSHPLLGSSEYPNGEGQWNRLIDAIFDVPVTQEMYLRRLRTLMDELLQPAATPYSQRHFEQRVDELQAAYAADGQFDAGAAAFLDAVAALKNEYLVQRRDHLYNTHGPAGSGLIPGPQPAAVAIDFGALEFQPTSGNQDEEYIELINPGSTAVDISGWRLSGGIEHDFKPGTVIPAGGSLYVTPSVPAFLARSTGPGGSQGLLVQGNYRGHLSSFGETVRLIDADGVEVNAVSYQGDPSPQQQFLRITEVMYNPPAPTAAEIAAGYTDNDDFEFIELINTGSDPLDLSGLRFTKGVQFDFTGSAVTTLAAGEYVLVVADQDAFEFRYGTGHRIAGEFVSGRLDNGGEEIKLEDAVDGTIQSFDYNDSGAWPGKADGKGASLIVVDMAGNYSDNDNWRPSVEYGGNPGTAAAEPLDDVRINEVLAQGAAGQVDAIELFNPTDAVIDVGGWYLSNDSGQYHKFRIPDGTTIAPGRFLVFDESDFNSSGTGTAPDFVLDGTIGGDVWLMAADATGRLTRFVDHAEFTASVAGISFGRTPDGEGGKRLRAMASVTLGDENSDGRDPGVIITEIMYHPASDNPLDEYIELYNNGAATIDLDGWEINGGVNFDFPGRDLAMGEYLVVAADPNTFRLSHPTVPETQIVGGWSGRLSDRSEEIELEDDRGERVDQVVYADEGDWARRKVGPNDRGHFGWIWLAEHDGLGKSLELVNPELPNDYGQNWAPSGPDGGTPGLVNSVTTFNVAPLILDVTHFPLVPRSVDPVTVTARLIDEPGGNPTATVYYRVDVDGSNPFVAVAMRDDGLGADAKAGDGIYSAELPAGTELTFPDDGRPGQVVEFYVEATDGSLTRTWPAPAQLSEDTADLGQVTNALYAIDDTFDPDAAWDPESQPLYYLVMTDAERDELRDIGLNDGDNDHRSDAQFNATFISFDGADAESRYNVGVRNRGKGSRNRPPNNYRVNLAHDRPWEGVTELNINSKYAHNQIIGSVIFRMAGLPAAAATGVQIRVNTEDLATTGSQMYGTYAYLEPLSGDFIDRVFPDDNDGNVYKIGGDGHLGHLTYLGTDPQEYINDGYFKQTNEVENDWSDLIHLTDVLTNVRDETYVEQVTQLIDVDQWLRWIAVHHLTGNDETNLGTGSGDDFSMYRGVEDPRFILLPHDLDTLFSSAANPSIFQAAGTQQIAYFLQHPAFVGRYYAILQELIDTVFSPEQINPLLDNVLGGYVPESRLDTIKQYVVNRNAAALAQIPREHLVHSDLPQTDGYYHSTDGFAVLDGTANAATTRSVMVNGQLADWSAQDGRWSTSTGFPLVPGMNRVLVQTFDGPDGTGSELTRDYVDIWYDDGTMQNVSGTIAADTTWTAAAGPYHVTGDITVGAGATLYIEPGTTVFFDAGTGLTVNGRLDAQGTADAPIWLTSLPGGGNWDGIDLIYTEYSDQVNRIGHARIDHADAAGRAIQADHAQLVLDSVEFAHHDGQYLTLDNSSVDVRDCIFPDISGGELIHYWGFPANGYARFEGNYFGRTAGYNDTIDFTGGQRPGPIAEFYNNFFAGGADDGLDLHAADAHIEGNVFIDFHQDAAREDKSHAVSTGTENGQVSQITVVGNLFYDVDHAILTGDGGFGTIVNNTIAGVHKIHPDATTAAINLYEARSGQWQGDGVYVDGNIFYDVQRLFENPDPVGYPSAVTVNNSIIYPLPAGETVPWTGSGNIFEDPRLRNTTNVTDPRVDLQLMPGSPAIGAGHNGVDIGGLAVLGPSISGEPPALTPLTEATLTVGGPHIYGYRYRVNDGAWSGERAPVQPIELTGLADGTYTVYVVQKNSAGAWQDDAQATASKTWTVDTSFSRVRINEVLAVNSTAVEHNGEYPDLIELINDGAVPVDLEGMGITDDADQPYRFVFPAGTGLLPGERLVLYADDASVTGELHLGFSLDGGGEAVYLFGTAASGGGLLDSVEFGLQVADLSTGRVGHNGEWTLTEPTFGSPNEAARTGDPQTLMINEWFAASDVRLADDFVELYNPDPLPVSLAGLYLTDNPTVQPGKHRIAPLSFIAGGGFAALVADGQPQKGPEHLDFRLSEEGEMIGLFDAGLAPIDQVVYYPQTTDYSQGRSPDGSETLAFYRLPTPGMANPWTSTVSVGGIPLAGDWVYDESGTDLGTDWRLPAFDDSAFSGPSPAVFGWEDGTLPAGATINTELVDGPITYYFRKHFNVAADPAAVALTMTTLIDDSAIFYLNGVEVMRLGFADGQQVAFDTYAGRTITNATYEGLFSLPTDALQSGDNVLAVELHQNSTGNRDIVFDLSLDATASVFNDPQIADALALIEGLRVTELMYNPAGSDIAEFIELTNVGPVPLDLAGVRLDGAVEFTFPAMQLAPGQQVVVVGDLPAFHARYGPGANIAGEFIGNLSDGGEQLVVELPEPFAAAIQRFEYDDVWYPQTDGGGFALVTADPTGAQVDFDQPAAWQPGTLPDGSPGHDDGQPAPRGVVVNELFAATGTSPLDMIELYNASADPVDLGGWYLSHSSDALLQYRIADGTQIAPGEYLVVSHVPGSIDAQGLTLDGLRGGELWLVEADAAGVVTRVADVVRYGATEEIESTGRWENAQGAMHRMMAATFDLVDPTVGENSGPSIGPLVISELMYAPANVGGGIDPGDLEFLEIFNPTGAAVSLLGWWLGEGIDYDFGNVSLAAYSTLVVLPFDPADAANDYRLRTLLDTYGVDYEVVADRAVPSIAMVGGYAGRLGDDGERVVLERPGTPEAGTGFVPHLVEDGVLYADTWYASTDGGGNSLQRIVVDGWGDLAASWIAGAATPGTVPTLLPEATVQGRYVFYNNSHFDGGDPAANGQDDAAVATDKQALLPGETASFLNYTSYSRGINGLMIDVAGLRDTPSLEDFVFRVGNDGNPDHWADAPDPEITVRFDANVGGTDRITLVWPDGAIENTWLQVTLLAGAHTGLTEPDVFYFGNAIGETGDSASNAMVTSVDEIAARHHPQIFTPTAIDNPYDFNRDGLVSAVDQVIARRNITVVDALELITAPAPVPLSTPVASPSDDLIFADAAALQEASLWLHDLDDDDATDADPPAADAVDRLLATLGE